jgi:hypothetical protein
MSCWICEECGYKNCDMDECLNPKCSSHKKKKEIPQFPHIDKFPTVKTTFGARIK